MTIYQLRKHPRYTIWPDVDYMAWIHWTIIAALVDIRSSSGRISYLELCIDHRIQLTMKSWKSCCIISDLIRSNNNVCDHNINLLYLRIAACTADIMNSASVVFIFILNNSSFPYIHHSLQVDNCNILRHDIIAMAIFWNNLKGLDFSSLLTCRDLYNAFTNFHATFSQLRIGSLPLAHGDIEKMCPPFRRQYFKLFSGMKFIVLSVKLQ